ncbi:protein-(glutamine-N5) methyltransferase, release factor-specific [Alkalilimnicola ehrlichii]|uniref:Release factor glutamine methyltransferase n=1 Tax=Alkalilimnicola ehrlichii TaxID=351052 RepID=A0A3E0X4G0_9GAMM|nr:protein-(glutamine-N5) methyltransferase, release factor-specific [Alkalilimnicola ehrlichii]RFA39634.1 protein-(glutamine-N5) methyltransferase, release factor-specific [Alkalilimnicola ehrlichii]
MATLAAALAWGEQCLYGLSDSARLDAEVLLCHCLKVNRSFLYTWPERALDTATQEAFTALVEQRHSGQPVAYLIGAQEFWSLPLRVTPDTLIPRPETELLVEQALVLLPSQAAVKVADLGTGSGAIALAIASERPQANVIAVDNSAGALAVARDNRDRLGFSNVDLRQGDWFAPLVGERLHVIVSNPPYIGAEEPEPYRGDCRFEPATALLSEDAGLADLRTIIQAAPNYLTPHGALLLEHGYRQGAAVRQLLTLAGFEQVVTIRDLNGHERVSRGRLPNTHRPDVTHR